MTVYTALLYEYMLWIYKQLPIKLTQSNCTCYDTFQAFIVL